MKHQPDAQAGWQDHGPSEGLPAPLDCETRALLRLFLAPILDCAESWKALAERLADKGYQLTFRRGHMVILNDQGAPLCTARDIGVPLSQIAQRIGRPRLAAGRDGTSGALHRSIA